MADVKNPYGAAASPYATKVDVPKVSNPYAKVEEDLAQKGLRELTEGEAKVRAAMSQTTDQYRAESRPLFWLGVVFQTQDQLLAFLEAVGLDPKRMQSQHIDGRELARALKLQLPPGPEWKPHRPKREFAEAALPLPGEPSTIQTEEGIEDEDDGRDEVQGEP